VFGEILDLVNTINSMIDQLSIFASEVKKVAREVGTEGKLGVQAEVGNVQGIWQEITYAFRPSRSGPVLTFQQHVRQYDGQQLDYPSARFRSNFRCGHGRGFHSFHHR